MKIFYFTELIIIDLFATVKILKHHWFYNNTFFFFAGKVYTNPSIA